MKIMDLETYLDERIPKSLSCQWDNDGRMILPDPDREIRRVLIALDVTDDVIDRALDGSFDLILSHHPLVFHPLRSVDDTRIIRLIQSGIAVFSYHTRLDAVNGGVNDCLSRVLALSSILSFGEEGMGRIGRLEREMTPREFGEYLKTKLGTSRLTSLIENSPIRTVAVLGGAGKDCITDALIAGADAFVTGEASYNALLDAKGQGMSIFCAGHYHTEQPVCRALAEWVREACPDAQIEVMESNPLYEL